jgi:hypothetical protein
MLGTRSSRWHVRVSRARTCNRLPSLGSPDVKGCVQRFPDPAERSSPVLALIGASTGAAGRDRDVDALSRGTTPRGDLPFAWSRRPPKARFVGVHPLRVRTPIGTRRMHAVSFLVALTGRNCGVVGTDARRFEGNGTHRDDFPRTFRVTPAAVGGYTGWLDVNGNSVGALVERLLPARNIDDLVAKAKQLFESELTADPKGALDHRSLDLVVLAPWNLRRQGKAAIRSVCFRAVDDAMSGTIKDFAHVCTGDDSSIVAVSPELDQIPQDLPLDRLKALAIRLIRKGIDAAGPHPFFAGITSCGGEPHLVWYSQPR